jgi:hypothetical protein
MQKITMGVIAIPCDRNLELCALDLLNLSRSGYLNHSRWFGRLHWFEREEMQCA